MKGTRKTREPGEQKPRETREPKGKPGEPEEPGDQEANIRNRVDQENQGTREAWRTTLQQSSIFTNASSEG